ncbi:MAG: CpaF family protein [Anaerolineae bacterium]
MEDELEQPTAPRMLGTSRGVSLAGVLEKITRQFTAEVENRPEILLESDAAARRALIKDITDYVLAVETIRLTREDRLAVMDAAYRDLFEFGVLHALLSDPAVDEIEIAASDRIFARRNGQKSLTEVQFEDNSQFERVTRRVLLTAGIVLESGEPILEAGAVFARRMARITATLPPISQSLQVHLRLHPVTPLTLDDLVANETLSAEEAQKLRAWIAARRGIMIVGDVDSGKTTLIGALLPIIAAQAGEHRLVQRALELHPNPAITPILGGEDFPTRLKLSLKDLSQVVGYLIADEIRFDESREMWDAITESHKPPLLWAFRGATDPLRLRTAFSMSVRRAMGSIDQAVINRGLLDRLPCVATMARRGGNIKLIRLAEWGIEGDSLTLLS